MAVVPSDAAGNASEKTVSLSINTLDDFAPQITSSASAVAVVRSGGASQQVYSASAIDTGDISAGLRFDLKPGSDPALRIDGATGQLFLTGQPQRRPYVFTLMATDAAGNASEQRCELQIKMVGADPRAYDAVREVEVISDANGSISFVLQGEHLLLDATQLAWVAQTLTGSSTVRSAAPAPAAGAEPLVLMVSSLGRAPEAAAFAREWPTATSSPAQSASAQMLATPELVASSSHVDPAQPSVWPSPPAEAAPVVTPDSPATAPVPPVGAEPPPAPKDAGQPGAGAPVASVKALAEAAPGPELLPLDSDRADSDAGAKAGRPAAWLSVLAEVYARIKARVAGAAPDPVALPAPDASAPAKSEPAAVESAKSPNGAGGPGR